MKLIEKLKTYQGKKPFRICHDLTTSISQDPISQVSSYGSYTVTRSGTGRRLSPEPSYPYCCDRQKNQYADVKKTNTLLIICNLLVHLFYCRGLQSSMQMLKKQTRFLLSATFWFTSSTAEGCKVYFNVTTSGLLLAGKTAAMSRVTTLLQKGKRALQELELLKVLQSEIRHELANDPYKNETGSSGDFVMDWDSQHSKDVTMIKKCESGEELAISAILGEETFLGDDCYPKEVDMKFLSLQRSPVQELRPWFATRAEAVPNIKRNREKPHQLPPSPLTQKGATSVHQMVAKIGSHGGIKCISL
ncbi:unnamed protein product [Lactuca saligna]|uniref:Uncharacterized protein n=1 Tax=Lactuca saligna TaxID=75948 RepID=A0AA35Z8U8_LACSI|nr:unnamed protein product [Lactuca saligna]